MNNNMLRKFLLVETITQQIYSSLYESVGTSDEVPAQIKNPSKPYKILEGEAMSKYFPAGERALQALFSKNTYNIGRTGKFIEPLESFKVGKRHAKEAIESSNLSTAQKDEYLTKLNQASELFQIVSLVTELIRALHRAERVLEKTSTEYLGIDPQLDRELFDPKIYKNLKPEDAIAEAVRRIYKLANFTGIRTHQEDVVVRMTPGEFDEIEVGDILVRRQERDSTVNSKGRKQEIEDPDTGEISYIANTKTIKAGTPIGRMFVQEVMVDPKTGKKKIGGKLQKENKDYSDRVIYYTYKDLYDDLYTLPQSMKPRRQHAPGTADVFIFINESEAQEFKKEIDTLTRSSAALEDYFRVVIKYGELQAEKAVSNVAAIPRTFFDLKVEKTEDKIKDPRTGKISSISKTDIESTEEYIERINKYIEQFNYAKDKYIQQLLANLPEKRAEKYIYRLENLINSEQGQIRPGIPSPHVFDQIDRAIGSYMEPEVDEDELGVNLIELREMGGILPKAFEEQLFNTILTSTKLRLTEELKGVEAGEIALAAFMDIASKLEYEPVTIQSGEVIQEGTFLGDIEQYLDAIQSEITIFSRQQVLEAILSTLKIKLTGQSGGGGMLVKLQRTAGDLVDREEFTALSRKIQTTNSLTGLMSAIKLSPLNQEVYIIGLSPNDVKTKLGEEIITIIDTFRKFTAFGGSSAKLLSDKKAAMEGIKSRLRASSSWGKSMDDFFIRDMKAANMFSPENRYNVPSTSPVDELYERVILGLKSYIKTQFVRVKKHRSLYTMERVNELVDDCETISDIVRVAVDILGEERGYDTNINNMIMDLYDSAEARLETFLQKQTYTTSTFTKLVRALKKINKDDSYLENLERFIKVQFPIRTLNIDEFIPSLKNELVKQAKDLVLLELNTVPRLTREARLNILATMSEGPVNTLHGLTRLVLSLTGSLTTGLEQIIYAAGGLQGMKDTAARIVGSSKIGSSREKDRRRKQQIYSSLYDSYRDLESDRRPKQSKEVQRTMQNIGLGRIGYTLGLPKNR